MLGMAYVPPPPETVAALTNEAWCAFCNGDDLPAIAQAAVAHAQFETIHPFVDGNGRSGRALIHVILRRRGLAPACAPSRVPRPGDVGEGLRRRADRDQIPGIPRLRGSRPRCQQVGGALRRRLQAGGGRRDHVRGANRRDPGRLAPSARQDPPGVVGRSARFGHSPVPRP